MLNGKPIKYMKKGVETVHDVFLEGAKLSGRKVTLQQQTVISLTMYRWWQLG